MPIGIFFPILYLIGCLLNIPKEYRVQQLAYIAYIFTPTFIDVCMIFDMSTFQIFQSLSGSYNFMLFKNLLL